MRPKENKIYLLFSVKLSRISIAATKSLAQYTFIVMSFSQECTTAKYATQTFQFLNSQTQLQPSKIFPVV